MISYFWLIKTKLEREEEQKNKTKGEKKMADKKYKVSGLLKGVEISNGAKASGDKWERASVKIEKSDGSSKYISTFDTNSIKAANAANGKEIEVQYTKSKDGKYNNMVDGTIKELGQGEAPVTEDEAVEEEGDAVEEEKPQSEADKKYHMKKIPEGTKPQPKMYSDDYWREKFEFEKMTYEMRQISIVRQNSWTQANKYLESCLKAVELGLIPKKDFTSKEIAIDKIEAIAHKIEADILRDRREDKKPE